MFFAPIRWAIRLVFLVILAGIVYLVVSGYQVYGAQGSLSSSLPPHSAAIVVFVATGPTGALSTDAIARLTQARSLYDSHVASRIVVAGPSPGGALPASLRWTSAHGLAGADVSSEPARNLAAALGVLAPSLGRGASVAIVTDAVDALVAKSGAASAGLVATVVAVAGSAHGFASEIGPLFDQASAVALGRVVGLSRVPWSGG